MTVATTASRAGAFGDGSTTAFAFPYEYREAADLRVVLVDEDGVSSTKTLNVHYTVSGVSDRHGGYSSATVTMVTAPALGEVLFIARVPRVVQATNVESQARPLYALNNALDRQTYILQWFLSEGVRLPLNVSYSPTLPDAPLADGVDYALGLKADRSGFEWLDISGAGGGGGGGGDEYTPTWGDIVSDDGGPLSHSDSEVFGLSYRYGALTGHDIYDAIFPDVNHADIIQGVNQIDAGSTIEHSTGLAGYIYNSSDSTNGVALYGCGIAAVDDAAIWGLNTLLQDAPTRTIGTGTGRILIGAELDFNVMCPDTQVIGISVGGNSLAQSSNAVAFICNSLGTGFEWTTAYYSMDGAAVNGLALGALATSGTNIDSQPILLSYFNGAAAKKTLTIYAETNALVIGNNDTDLTVTVSGYVNVPSTKGFAVDATLVRNLTTEYFPSGGILNFNSGDVTVTHSANLLTIAGGNLSITSGTYRVNGTAVVGAQGAAVADASGGATVDSQARTALNDLLARLRTHGLIAT